MVRHQFHIDSFLGCFQCKSTFFKRFGNEQSHIVVPDGCGEIVESTYLRSRENGREGKHFTYKILREYEGTSLTMISSSRWFRSLPRHYLRSPTGCQEARAAISSAISGKNSAAAVLSNAVATRLRGVAQNGFLGVAGQRGIIRRSKTRVECFI